eukprot:TRINITY_DN12868_c0_g2_i2.p1 TRINITY_DN12868_c0_g2~~TRINITY_DN12868_c0_g2_i2.p1  ORF type:complete len:281 (-),score=-14.78 TRINITY_DN12868_c0_g2_i2:45-821(-)
MDYIDGIPIDKTKTLKQLGYNMEEICTKLIQNYCHQILDTAFFHADPHPGNIWIKEGKIIWLDYGMMGTISERDKKLFGKAMFAVANNNVSDLKNVLLSMGKINGSINHTSLYNDIEVILSSYMDLEFSNMHMGKMLEEVIEVAKRNNISMPPGITMLGRGCVTIEGVLEKCAPNVNMMKIISIYVASKINEDFNIGKVIRSSARDTSEAISKGIKIPSQLSELLQASLKGQVKLNLEVMGSKAVSYTHLTLPTKRIV